MKFVLLISHGSRFSKTKEEVKILVRRLRESSSINIFEYAFLEIETPSIPDGIETCIQKGATDILILLNFLNSGRHVDEDIPKIIEKAKRQYPNISFHISKPVGQHENIIKLFLDMLH